MIKKKPEVEELFFPAEPAANSTLRLALAARSIAIRAVAWWTAKRTGKVTGPFSSVNPLGGVIRLTIRASAIFF